jgi:hypothetical protein
MQSEIAVSCFPMVVLANQLGSTQMASPGAIVMERVTRRSAPKVCPIERRVETADRAGLVDQAESSETSERATATQWTRL